LSIGDGGASIRNSKSFLPLPAEGFFFSKKKRFLTFATQNLACRHGGFVAPCHLYTQ
jgi:hypothetical protein